MSLADDRAICEAATPGPWLAMTDEPYEAAVCTEDGMKEITPWMEERGCLDADATFIAHFNPAYVARLLDVVEAAEQLERAPELSAVKRWREHMARKRLSAALLALKAVDDA